jgi:hypothetical protein
MSTNVYVDHNITRYLIGYFPKEIDSATERAAFERMRARNPDLRFVISMWSTIEAADGNDERRVRECAKFLGDLKALVIRDKSGLAKAELSTYVYEKFYGVKRPLEVFYESYPKALYDLGVKDAAVAAHSVEQDILDAFRNPKWLAPIRQQAAALPAILTDLAKAKHDGSLTLEMRAKTIESWLSQFFPLRDPDDKPIRPDARCAMMRELTDNMRATYQACPSLRIEDELSEFRTDDKNRKPQRQDAADLMMAVPALAYCDAFISSDGYVTEGATRLLRGGVIKCLVARLPSEVAKHFGI